MIRIAIADDHGVVRQGLRLLIEAQSDMEVVAELGDGAGVVEAVREHSPDVLVVDWSMPHGGLSVLEEVRGAGLPVRVLVLTMHERPAYARRALDAGADGFLVKRSAADTVLVAIRKVAAGERYVDGEVADKLEEDDDPLLEPRVPLSPREVEVLKFIAEGHTNQETADQLGLSVKTVEGYRARVAQKLSARSRADLVRYALQVGLL
jgi:DNA-binding NarL/FixJ family response regulator